MTVTSSTGMNGRDSIPVTTIKTPNIEPTINTTWSNIGQTVTITDTSVDPDNNFCDNSGDALVKIDRGPGGYVDYYVPITDPAPTDAFSYTYASPGTYTILYGVQDNAMTSPNFAPNFQVTVP